MSTLAELTALIASTSTRLRVRSSTPMPAGDGARAALEALKVAWTGRKASRIAAFMGHLPSLPPADSGRSASSSTS